MRPPVVDRCTHCMAAVSKIAIFFLRSLKLGKVEVLALSQPAAANPKTQAMCVCVFFLCVCVCQRLAARSASPRYAVQFYFKPQTPKLQTPGPNLEASRTMNVHRYIDIYGRDA